MKARRFVRVIAAVLVAMMGLSLVPAVSAEGKTVTVTSVTEENGVVTVKGTAAELGQRKVEIIVNGDLSQRYVADNDENGNFVCEFELPYNGEYSIEASVRDYSDFSALRQRVPDESYFEMNGACTWGSSIVKHSDGLYYMLFSTWDEAKGFSNWYTYSEIAYATSTKLGGPYIYQGPALDVEGSNITNEEMPKWNGGKLAFFHNPNIMHSEKDGKYYLYFISRSSGSDQKVGVAYADTPAGPWTIKEDPVITTREGYHDNSYVNNPSVIELKDAEGNFSYYAVYRSNGYEDGVIIRAAAYATADSPLGPFTQSEERIMYDPTSDYSVEDCHVWFENGQYYALAKDMTGGKITGYTDGSSTALYESTDGVNWALSEHKLAYPTIIPWESGDQKVGLMDRAFVYREKGVPFMLTNATSDSNISPHTGGHTLNVQIPLLGTVLAADTYALSVTDGKDKTVDKSELNALLPYATDAVRDFYTEKDWYRLYTAARAGRIVAERDDAEQADVDFAVAEIKEVINNRIEPSAAPVNVALNKTVTASSNYSNESQGSYPAELAVDGQYGTRWSAANGVTGTVTYEIDLGARYQLDGFMMEPLDDRVSGYNVQYYNGSEWKQCFATATGETSGEFAISEPAEKVLFSFTDYQKPPTIFEIEVYGTYQSENIALNKATTSNSNYSTTYTAVKAVDGNVTNDTARWSAKGNVSGTVYLEIDLSGKYYIDNFYIDEFRKATETTGRITNYTWEYYDGTEWKTCFSGTNEDGVAGNSMHFHLSGDFDGEIAEKLRLNMNAYTAAPSIWEIEIYGALAYGDVAAGKSVEASSVYNNSSIGYYPAENAVDGDVSTRWAAQNAAGTVTFDIKLGDSYKVESFKISEFKDRITSYSWQYYKNGRWVTCYEGTNEGIEISGNYAYLEGDFTEQDVTDRLRLNMLTYTADPSIWEIEVYGSTVRSTGVSLAKDSLSLLDGETATLTATITPDDATNTALRWSSSDESVATVDQNGVVTALNAGETVITVTTKDTGCTDTCTLTVAESVATVDGKFFATFAEAMAVAKSGDTVKLLADAAADFIAVEPGVTLDLNAHVLSVTYAIGFKDSAVIDSSKDNGGKLLIADKDKVALDKTNGGYLPVYEENGYIFTTVKLAGRSDFVTKTQFAFSPVFETFSHEALMEGYEKSGVEIIIRLTWENAENYRAKQDFIYLDERVYNVINSYDASKANYGLAFAASFEGSEAGDAENVQVTAVVVSDTGVEIAGAPVAFAGV